MVLKRPLMLPNISLRRLGKGVRPGTMVEMGTRHVITMVLCLGSRNSLRAMTDVCVAIPWGGRAGLRCVVYLRVVRG